MSFLFPSTFYFTLVLHMNKNLLTAKVFLDHLFPIFSFIHKNKTFLIFCQCLYGKYGKEAIVASRMVDITIFSVYNLDGTSPA